jgi:hypothetical protein
MINWAFATYFYRERVGRLLRLALAIRSSSGSLIDFTICREAPLSCDLGLSPRLAANAAPAAICCFFDFAGMRLPSFPGWPHTRFRQNKRRFRALAPHRQTAVGRTKEQRSERMRKLIFALSALSFAVPASAQTFYTGYGWGPYVGVGWGPSYSYDYGYSGWGPSYDYGWGPLAVGIYAAPPVASTVIVQRPARRVVRERVVRYRDRDRAYGAYAYAPGYRAYSSPYVGVGIGPRYGWYYE